MCHLNALDCLKRPELHRLILGKLSRTFQPDPHLSLSLLGRGFHVGDPLFALTSILILGGDSKNNILTQGFIFALILLYL
jgi:hypothetical protein